MKQNILKTTLFYCLFFFIFNCQKEDDINDINNSKSSEFSVRSINKKQLKSNQKIVNKLRALRPEKNKNRNNSEWLNRDIYDAELGFTINTEEVLEIENNTGYNSYSFNLTWDEPDDNNMYNLLLSINNIGEYDTYIVKYGFTYEEYTTLDSSLLNARTTEYYPIDFDSSTFNDGEFAKMDARFHYVCVETWEWQDNTQDHNGELHGADCNCEPSGGSWILISNQCSLVGGGGNGSSTSSSPGNNNNTDPTYNNTGSSSGSGSSDPVIVSAPTYSPSQAIKEFFINLDTTLRDCLNNNLDFKSDVTAFLTNTIGPIATNSNTIDAEAAATEMINSFCNDNIVNSFEDAIEEYFENNIEAEDFFASQIIIAPDDPINNIQEYLNCFDTSQGAQITFNADQPTANDDGSWSLPMNVGHAFITITQGNTIRSFGLYPIGTATPFNPEDPPVFGNNQNTEYDVNVTVSVSAFQFDAIITESITYETNYHLSTNNCTNFALDISQLAGLDIPDTHGEWPGGNGNNPGAFGEDLRTLELPAGATRDVDGGNSPQNSTPCN